MGTVGASATRDLLGRQALAKTAVNGIVLGYGSVGRAHAAELASMTSALAILDVKEAARAHALAAYASGIICCRLEELDREAVDWASAVAVIATWGPSHAELFHALADRGVRRILCEKPLACSLAQAQGMVRRARTEGIALGVHHVFRYAGFAAALRELAQTHALGSPVSLVVHGGAAGLIMNGIHFIDLACELFGPPRHVISTAHGEPIEPRNQDLLFYGGTIVWSFDGGREVVVAFSNDCSIKWTVRIYFRDAFVDLGPDRRVLLMRRDPDAVTKAPAVTRTGAATQRLFEGPLPGVRTKEEAIRAALRDVMEGGATICPGEVSLEALSACVGALAASAERRAVELPIDPASHWGQMVWPFT